MIPLEVQEYFYNEINGRETHSNPCSYIAAFVGTRYDWENFCLSLIDKGDCIARSANSIIEENEGYITWRFYNSDGLNAWTARGLNFRKIIIDRNTDYDFFCNCVEPACSRFCNSVIWF